MDKFFKCVYLLLSGHLAHPWELWDRPGFGLLPWEPDLDWHRHRDGSGWSPWQECDQPLHHHGYRWTIDDQDNQSQELQQTTSESVVWLVGAGTSGGCLWHCCVAGGGWWFLWLFMILYREHYRDDILWCSDPRFGVPALCNLLSMNTILKTMCFSSGSVTLAGKKLLSCLGHEEGNQWCQKLAKHMKTGLKYDHYCTPEMMHILLSPQPSTPQTCFTFHLCNKWQLCKKWFAVLLCIVFYLCLHVARNLLAHFLSFIFVVWIMTTRSFHNQLCGQSACWKIISIVVFTHRS